jgi:hypothetical protein
LNPDRTKGGYLKQRGYRPENVDERDEDRSEPRTVSSTYQGPKQPRPELKRSEEIKREEEQNDKQKKRELKELAQSETKRLIQKDPKLKKTYQIRNTLVILGIIVLGFSLAISYQNYLNLQPGDDSLERKGYAVLRDLQESDDLATDQNLGFDTWELNKFLTINSTQITHGLEDSHQDMDFIIEVHDLSNYPIKYNRTILNGKAWSNHNIELDPVNIPEDNFEISTLINIYVSPQEIHLARVSVTVWNE